MTYKTLENRDYTVHEIARLAQNQTFPVIREYNGSCYAGILSTIARQTVEARLNKPMYSYEETKEILAEVDANLREYFDDTTPIKRAETIKTFKEPAKTPDFHGTKAKH